MGAGVFWPGQAPGSCARLLGHAHLPGSSSRASAQNSQLRGTRQVPHHGRPVQLPAARGGAGQGAALCAGRRVEDARHGRLVGRRHRRAAAAGGGHPAGDCGAPAPARSGAPSAPNVPGERTLLQQVEAVLWCGMALLQVHLCPGTRTKGRRTCASLFVCLLPRSSCMLSGL